MMSMMSVIITIDFRETKIRILSEEHSKEFQEAVFEAGGEWRQTGRFYQKGAKYIFVDKHLSMLYYNDVEFFQEHDYKEIWYPTAPINVKIPGNITTTFETAKVGDKV